MIKFGLFFLLPALLCAQQTAGNTPINGLLSEPGSTFRFADSQLPGPLTFIAYGDQRFTDPANVKSADPRVRRWLVNQIASEHPAAVVL
ncbi:MAG TPA: hypothetical protein VGL82_16550, partial [Bryobacteraceae bacterium]